MNKHQPRHIALAASLACFAASALGQSIPNIGDALHQAQAPAAPVTAAPALPPIGGAAQKLEAPMTALPSGPTVAVHSVEVVGNSAIDTPTLAALVADGAGKSLTLAELDGLAQRVTRYYRGHGYFVARAYIPAQDVTSGALKIRVIEGRYGSFHLNNKSLLRDRAVQAMLDDAKRDSAVSVAGLERVMLIVNDTPGVQITRADVMPGEQVGAADFAVDTTASAPYAGYIMLDNYGSAYTGKERLSFNVDANSPTGGGDRLSLSGLGTNHGGLLNGRAAYSSALAPNGLRGELALSQTNYSLGGTYSALDAVGTAKALDATLRYPIRHTRAQTVEASVNFAYRDLVDEIRSTATRIPKTLVSATAGVSIKDERAVLGFDGQTEAGAALSFGDLDIREDGARALDAAGVRANGHYAKLALNLSRVSLLPNNFTLTTALRGQYALNDKNLDGSERMPVSGSGAVMAYPSGELIGDNAAFVHVELGRPLATMNNVQSAWTLFSDYGAARAGTTATTTSRRHIGDVGIGLNASYRGALLRVNLAHRIDSAAPVSEPAPRDKLLLLAGWTF